MALGRTAAPSPRRRIVWYGVALGLLLGAARPSVAQVTPAAGYTPPDDTPSIKFGVVLFTNYTYQDEPQITDVDGNLVDPNSFDVTRFYINATGNLSHRISYRLTPDITRMTTTGATNNLDGSLTFRVKYAYGQFNLDEAWSKGSWVRFGAQDTPYVTWLEGIYRYRFQGQIAFEREGFIASSDFGMSTRYKFAGNYGEFHAGYYNGENYNKAEANSEKAIEARVSFRPMPMTGVLKGLMLTASYDGDAYAKDDPRRRAIYAATFEHRFVNAAFEYLSARDQVDAAAAEVKSSVWSAWATPRFGKGWEALLRYDHAKPNDDVEAIKDRRIGGIAYWFKTQGPATASVLGDYEAVTYDALLAKPDERRYAVHLLFNY